MADKQDDTTLKAGSNQFDTPVDMAYLIRQSNLIEGVDDPKQDRQSARAWSWLKSRVGINEAVLLELHHRIMAGQLPEAESGHYRKVPVWIGGKEAPFQVRVPELIRDWLQNMAFYIDHMPKELHIEFEKIHPFIDGNGRTGRMLMWWHELKLGQQPTPILNAKKQDYYKWFKPNATLSNLEGRDGG